MESAFIFFSCCLMSLSKATKAWRSRYHLLLLLFLAGIGTLCYFYGFSYFQTREIASIEQEIQKEQEQIDRFYQNTGFKEFLAVKALEKERTHLPWSEYINKILTILAKVKHVEEGRGNVLLSDFKVNLQELSLNGVVSNLKTLYQPSHGAQRSLLEEFTALDFLKEITIRNYERGEDIRGFKFTLSANVLNHVSTGSTAHH